MHVIAFSAIAQPHYGASFNYVVIRFTLNANMSDINVCKICACKELLTTKYSSRGKTANSAVHHFDSSLDVEEIDGDDDESSDEDQQSDSNRREFDHEQHDETKNARSLRALI
jgi:hypothetical protein